MIRRLKSFIHLSLLLIGRLGRETRRWRNASGSATIEIPALRVFYGHERIPGRDEYSGGAMIKFQDLNDRFPNAVSCPNIIYLVTSALPLYPGIIVSFAKRHGAAIVLNQNGVAYPGWHGPGWERTNKSTRNLLQQADHVFYQSRFCKQSADRFAGTCSSPYEILANPVDTGVFVPASESPPGLRLLLAGSHEHWYRVEAALETVARLPEARLTIAGRFKFHPDTEYCIAKVHEHAGQLGITGQVDLAGPYSQEAAPKLFQAHHVLLHTKYNDPCPRLVVEAMSCGVPVVYSASGGVPELVGEEGGVGCKTPLDYEQDHPPAPEAMAQAVRNVTDNLSQFSRQARERATCLFDVVPWLDRHEQVFTGLLNSRTQIKRDG